MYPPYAVGAQAWIQRAVLSYAGLLAQAYLISQDMYAPALALLAAAGATDWLDGFLARRWNQASPLARGALSCVSWFVHNQRLWALRMST